MSREIEEIVISDINCPRGEPWVVGTVELRFRPRAEGFEGPTVTIATGCPWDRHVDTLADVRLRLVAAAHELLASGAALTEPQVEEALRKGLEPHPELDVAKLMAEAMTKQP